MVGIAGTLACHRDPEGPKVTVSFLAALLMDLGDLSGLPSGFLFLEGNGNIRIGGKAHLISLDVCEETHVDEVMVPLVGAFSAVFLRKLDAVADDTVDRSDMYAVGADDLRMFLNFRMIDHVNSVSSWLSFG